MKKNFYTVNEFHGIIGNRGNQQAFTDHHLILYPAGKVVLREGERQRHTVHAVVQGSFHVLAVNVGQQQVAQL